MNTTHHSFKDNGLQVWLGSGFYNVIDGASATADEHLSVINPSTGEELATVPDIGKGLLDNAVNAARKAFPGWSALPFNDRKTILSKALRTIEEHVEELSVLLTAEQGRPLAQARWEIDLLTKVFGPACMQMELPDKEQDVPHIGHVTKRQAPLGIVGAISPWNVPVILSFLKAFSALLAGNTVVLKPSPFTPLTVLRISEYIRKLFPHGVLNVVTGGDNLGPWMTCHPGIDLITFTGSTQTGKKVLNSTAPTLKHVSLELGGNDPGIVLPDADPQQIARALFDSMFLLSGQGCICLKRLYIHESIYTAVTDALVSIASTTVVGDGFNPETALGPVQNRRQYMRLRSILREIDQSGAPILYRGDIPTETKGFFVPVTLLDNPPDGATFVTQEVFGPIRSVFKYKDVNDAIRRANDTSYGLGASVWGTDPEELRKVAVQLEAGTVWINQHAVRNPTVPASAYKSSGRGVEFGQEGLEAYCQLQVIATKQ